MPKKKQESFAERRQYVRIDCLMAGRVVSVNTDQKISERISSTALTKNVSAGGLLFKDSHLYEIGQLVVVSINQGALQELDKNLADVIKTRDYVFGRIVRIEEFKGGEYYEYGVCFIRKDEEGLDYFNVFVNLINGLEFDQ